MVKTRGKTQRFTINKKFIFGASRCMRCGKTMNSGEKMICNLCKEKE